VIARSSPPGNRPEGKVVPVIQRGCPERLDLHAVLTTHLAQPLLHIQLLLRGLGRIKCSEAMAARTQLPHAHRPRSLLLPSFLISTFSFLPSERCTQPLGTSLCQTQQVFSLSTSSASARIRNSST